MKYIKLFENFSDSFFEDIKQYIQNVVDEFDLIKMEYGENIYSNTLLGKTGAVQCRVNDKKILIEFTISNEYFKGNKYEILEAIGEFENRVDDHLDSKTICIVDSYGDEMNEQKNHCFLYEIIQLDFDIWDIGEVPFGEPLHLWSLKAPKNALSKIRRSNGSFYPGAAFINNLHNT